jgi:hypothetical protein
MNMSMMETTLETTLETTICLMLKMALKEISLEETPSGTMILDYRTMQRGSQM